MLVLFSFEIFWLVCEINEKSQIFKTLWYEKNYQAILRHKFSTNLQSNFNKLDYIKDPFYYNLSTENIEPTDIDQSLSRSRQSPVLQLLPLQVLKSSLVEYNSHYTLQGGTKIEKDHSQNPDWKQLNANNCNSLSVLSLRVFKLRVRCTTKFFFPFTSLPCVLQQLVKRQV